MADKQERDETGDASVAIGNAVRDFLTQHELAVNPWLKSALGLGATAVWRKLNGEAKWTAEDLDAVASKMGLSLGDLLRLLAEKIEKSVPATCYIEGKEHALEVVLEDGPAILLTTAPYVAVERKGHWRVVKPAAVFPTEVARHIKRMSMSMKPVGKVRVALLDDDPSITDQAASVFEQSGFIQSERFASSEALIEKLDANTTYDAYVFDWRLADGTSEGLIKSIRSREASKKTPIFVVTGAIEAEGDAVEDDLARVVSDFGCKAMLKPVRWKLLQAEISQGVRTA